MPGAVFLRSNRLTLRTVESEDTDFIQRSRNEPGFREGFLLDFPRNRETVESHITEDAESDDSIRLFICVDESPVGCISLRKIRQDHGMLAYWLVPGARGQGYATEATALFLDHVFEEVGLHRVFAWTVADNEASQSLLRRLAFTHEGTYREHVFMRGAYRDTEHYGLLASEWPGSTAILDT